MKRKIININQDKCNGCGLCIPDCPEGALQMIDGKARLISDLFCDGLGACIGTCPEGAISVIEREATPYDEKQVMQNIIKQGDPVILAHLEHLVEHGEMKLFTQAVEVIEEQNLVVSHNIKQFIEKHSKGSANSHEQLPCGCPGTLAQQFNKNNTSQDTRVKELNNHDIPSELQQWPVQLKLLNPMAPYFNNANLLIAADCVPVAYGNFHKDFLKDKIVILFCPKLDPYVDEYIDKLQVILENHNISSITTVHMEVPCCSGVNHIVDEAMKRSGKNIPLNDTIITIQGVRK